MTERSFGRMASLAMASSMAVSMSSAGVFAAASPVFSSASSVRVASSASFAAPLRLSGVSRNGHVVARASPSGTGLEESVKNAIDEAEEVCKADESSGNCAAAWDEVEELAATVAHKKVSDRESKDPLEAFCKDVPEADECRTYED